ncbi:MAG TPA: capsular biosynthesis protein [Burkholderiaceae bacterium]|nr:capsular biosynthesis protein [Burkholderiaceae bacterium]
MNFLALLTPTRLKIGLIAVPMAIGAAYFGLFAADRYVSVSMAGLRSSTGETAALAGVASLLSSVSGPGNQDTYFLRDYMSSMALLKKLDAQLGLRAHYEAQLRDPLFRLWGWASQEYFLDYYRSRVSVTIDENSSALVVQAEGFDPQFAFKLNTAILEEAERFVNDYSHRIARENLRFAEGEFARAGDRLQQAKLDVLAFQNKHKLLDPMALAQASGVVTAELQGQITKTETELRSLRSFLNDNSPQVVALQSQLKSLQEQLNVERRRGTSGDNDKRSDRLNELAIEFKGLELQAEVALDVYKAALTAVEASRIESTRKLKSLVVIEPPTMPERAEYPRRWYNLLTLFVGCLLLLAVVRLVIATIQEHQD